MRSLLAIITGMMDAVFVVDGAGAWRSSTRGAGALRVARPEDVLGAAFPELFVDAAARALPRAPPPRPRPKPAPPAPAEPASSSACGRARARFRRRSRRGGADGGRGDAGAGGAGRERAARAAESLRESESKAVLLAHDLRCLIQYSNAPIFAVDPPASSSSGTPLWPSPARPPRPAPRRRQTDGRAGAEGDGGRAALRETLAGVLERGREVENHEVEFLCRPSAARRLASAHASVASGSESEVMTPAERCCRGRSRRRWAADGAADGERGGAAGPRRLDRRGHLRGQDMSEKVRMIEMKAAAHAKARLIAYVCVRSAGAAGRGPRLRARVTGRGQCHECSEQLLSVVNDLLDLSKLEAGMVTVESIAFDLRDVIECVAELVAPACYTKGIEIVCAISPDIPTRVYGDPTRLRQILINLAHNACKFTHDGYVLIRCESAEAVQHAREAAQRAGTAPSTAPPRRSAAAPPPRRPRPPHLHHLRHRHRDGMDPEGVARLFQDFVQVNETITRKYGGTGMGLSISKQLAELMGGRISATSTSAPAPPSSSSSPSAPSPPRPAGPPSPALPGPAAVEPAASSPGDLRLDPPVSVLVATSCAPVREALAAYLAALGCPVAFARSAARARALLRGPHRFDAVLVDDDLPAHEAADGASGRFALGPAASPKAAALPARRAPPRRRR
eukprot:tig00021682_g23104.t1